MRKVYSRLREHIYTMNAERLRHGEREITHDMISEETGITRATVTKWMNPKKELDRMDVQTWLKLAEFVGVEPNDLLSIEDSGERKSLSHQITTDFSAVPVMG